MFESSWQWIAQNPTVLSAVANLLMVLIWIDYLQLFLLQHRRQSRPLLIIHHAQDHDLGSACLLVNMSKETVHVESVIAHVESRRRVDVRRITEFRTPKPDDPHALRILRQGPIESGGYMLLGTFRQILLGDVGDDATSSDEGQEEEATRTLHDISALEIRIAVIHGPTKHPIGARRRFVVEASDGSPFIRPVNIHTEQLVHYRKRHEVRRWMENYANPKRTGAEETEAIQQTETKS